MNVSRSGFYNWLRRIRNPSIKEITRQSDINTFISYHNKYPSHGYRWLNAKIRLDIGVIYSDNYAFKCCHYAGIRSQAKHARYKRPKDATRFFPNLLIEGLTPNRPYEVVVSDMTAFKANSAYYELTLYMDLFNNEIVSYGLTTVRGNNRTYYDGLKDLIEKKKEYGDLELVLHTDQGSVYSSKAYNDLLYLNNITHSMSNPGVPTENAAMESINGWLKEELYLDFHIENVDCIEEFIPEYIKFFNEERPAYSLKYLTPKQYKELYTSVRQ